MTNALDERLAIAAELGRVLRERIDPDDAPELLGRYVGALTRQALRAHSKAGGRDAGAQLGLQIATVNRMVGALGELLPDGVGDADAVAASQELLLAVASGVALPGEQSFPGRPVVPLSASALFANRGRERIGHALHSELESADRVDLICAFIKWSGLRLLRDRLAEVVARGGELRVVTTTYMGASDLRAVDELVRIGAKVRVSYETQATRLHAKAWHFHRRSGTSTAYVGSSNMSMPALTDGVEWNVRFSEVEQGNLLLSFADNFESYWEDPEFELYDAQDQRQRERLRRALEIERSGPKPFSLELAPFDITPHPHQRQVLDELTAERDIHRRFRNLVVMATGTGKTMVAAMDYRRLREQRKVDSLLFVAHRQEILDQARLTFRHVLRESAFGEKYVGGDRPETWKHVFASVQSLAHVDLDRQLHPERFDMVIVDEFHHATARTYARLLDHLNPTCLLGLTATPERSDDADITHWFDGHTAVDLRLWEAVDRGLLVPFHYFGINDETDLKRLRFTRSSGYDTQSLTALYTGDDARVRLILGELNRRVLDPSRMRAIGFCVSIRHARFMAAKFNAAGIPAFAVTSKSSGAERDDAIAALRKREVNVLFTVDLFNEGVDIPEVDTVLFLRPTQSATVFLQQLGRGLRRADNKESLTVLDFIGAQHADFRFEPKIRALSGGSLKQALQAVEQGFPSLPSGCAVQLDQVARQTVLANLRSMLSPRWAKTVAELRALGDVSLASFLDETGLQPEDVYRPKDGTWSGLRMAAGLPVGEAGPEDSQLEKAVCRILHIDDPERLDYLTALAEGRAPTGTRPDERLAAMANSVLWGDAHLGSPLEQALRRLLAEPRRREELLQLLPVLRARMRRLTWPVAAEGPLPLHVHARYTRAEAVAAFGEEYKGRPTGVEWFPESRADAFFVTLVKSEHQFSESTRYEDRVITPTLFQWETQGKVAADSVDGQRYINHAERGSSLHLFVRETKRADGRLGAPPFLYLGPAAYESHVNDRPMRIKLRLAHALPLDVFTSWSQFGA
ncbi:DUF3427 domain-containing protein [Streptacidiphilus carbonis]|uniref:DUF3427 domain-containing protein n=1 Tax=Streptacidiphilus carbonis TaxID=105422 RepID=UPI001F3BB553|nr:DUF3427 domain-containing protein [Streptacidiphilus carbonis]